MEDVPECSNWEDDPALDEPTAPTVPAFLTTPKPTTSRSPSTKLHQTDELKGPRTNLTVIDPEKFKPTGDSKADRLRQKLITEQSEMELAADLMGDCADPQPLKAIQALTGTNCKEVAGAASRCVIQSTPLADSFSELQFGELKSLKQCQKCGSALGQAISNCKATNTAIVELYTTSFSALALRLGPKELRTLSNKLATLAAEKEKVKRFTAQRPGKFADVKIGRALDEIVDGAPLDARDPAAGDEEEEEEEDEDFDGTDI